MRPAPDVDRVFLAGERRELRQRVADGGVRRPIEDEPHRALVTVLCDEHHGPMEVRVVEDRSRDQQLPAQRLAHPTTVVDSGEQERERRGTALLLGVLLAVLRSLLILNYGAAIKARTVSGQLREGERLAEERGRRR